MPDHYCAEICRGEIEAFRQAFESDPRHRVALNAVTKTSAKNVAMNRQSVVRCNHTFSHVVQAGAATSQNHSGRCWMFAGLNLFRTTAAEQMNLEEFELSQTYLFFWDKVERANYFLESVLATLDEPTDGRLIAWLMSSPMEDGGQWDMFVNLVKKYGVVPKQVMPETESSSASGLMNDRVTQKLREYACRLRAAYRNGQTMESLQARKSEMVSEVYRVLCIHLGEPPTDFMWQWRTKEKVFHRDGIVTPQQFYERHVGIDLDAMVCMIHCPTPATPLNTLYTVEYLGNVVGGRQTCYLNTDLDTMKQAAVAQIKDERPVWFGCDVGKSFDRDLGLMDNNLYDFEGLYRTPFAMDKAERLDYGASQMTHAMVFTGVDLDEDGHPCKWRVENSWGDKFGEKGFMVMVDGWFDQYNYEVVVDRKYLSSDMLTILDTTPVILPPWHPMGALAR